MQIRTVVVGLLAATLTVAALPVARAAMDRPAWSQGDFWAYSFSITQEPYGTMNGTLRMDVTGTEDVVAGGTTYASYTVRSVLSASWGGQSLSVTFDMWYRTSDLAIVKETVEQSSMGYHFTSRMTYDPPIEIHWPLVPGASWSASSSLLTETQDPFGGWYNQTTTITADFVVQTETQVTVPAGTFAVIGLHQTGGGMFTGSAGTEYWSPVVGNAVRIATDGGSSTPTFDLTEYHYAATSWPWALVTIAVIVLPIALVGALLLRAIRRPAPPAPMPPQSFSPAPPVQEPPVQPPPMPPPGT